MCIEYMSRGPYDVRAVQCAPSKTTYLKIKKQLLHSKVYQVKKFYIWGTIIKKLLYSEVLAERLEIIQQYFYLIFWHSTQVFWYKQVPCLNWKFLI